MRCHHHLKSEKECTKKLRKQCLFYLLATEVVCFKEDDPISFPAAPINDVGCLCGKAHELWVCLYSFKSPDVIKLILYHNLKKEDNPISFPAAPIPDVVACVEKLMSYGYAFILSSHLM
jgi:hypothetical protein